jgi:hypothetical protein
VYLRESWNLFVLNIPVFEKRLSVGCSDMANERKSFVGFFIYPIFAAGKIN